MPECLTVTLAVADLDRCERFYRDFLGLPVERFTPLPGHPPLLLLRRDSASLLFREEAVFSALHPALFQALDRHPRGIGIMLELSLPDLRPVLRRAEKISWPLLYEMEDEEFERREVWLHDPDGYLLILGANRL